MISSSTQSFNILNKLILLNVLATTLAFAPLTGVSQSPSTSLFQWQHSTTYLPSPAIPARRQLKNFSTFSHTQLKASISDVALTPASSGLVLSSVAILATYHILLFRKEFKSEISGGSSKTWRQYQADTREDWARHVRATEGWLYAIQSLRNAITAQTFLATTVLSLLTLITGRMWDILRSTINVAERRLLTVQLSSIALTMLFSAYQFLQGVRLMTHAGFMFPVKNCGTKVDNIMRQTQNCQWMGLRWMYISLGPIAWAVGGSRAFFVAAILLLQFFRSIDKKPESLGYEEFQGVDI